MSDAARQPLFADRERRILLWVCAAAVCWRWMLAIRAPLPHVDAALGLRVGRELAASNFEALGEVWSGPWWSSLVAIGIAFGFEGPDVAVVLSCVFGGLALVPMAWAAQRCRAGAGLPVALLLFTMPDAAAAGSPVGIHMLLIGCVVALCASGRKFAPMLCAAVAVGQGGLAVVVHGSLAILVLIAGIGMARLALRLRDVVLTVAVGSLLLGSWQSVEPRTGVIERELGILAAERLRVEQRLVTTLPRVAYYAGRRAVSEVPPGLTVRQWSDVIDEPDVGGLVIGTELVAMLGQGLSDGYVRFQLSPRLADLAAAHDVTVLFRRE